MDPKMPKPPFTVAEFMAKGKAHGDQWQLDTEENAEIFEILGTKTCAEDEIWVCTACAKTSLTRYGFLKGGSRTFDDGKPVSDPGWDESCMLNARLFKLSQLQEVLADIKVHPSE
jgi:hypothetical protein